MSSLRRIMSGQVKPEIDEDGVTQDLERGLQVSENMPDSRSTDPADIPDYYLSGNASQPEVTAKGCGLNFALTRNPSQMSRTSNLDSEFSHALGPQGPQSPERYQQAWDKLSANSPKTPKTPKTNKEPTSNDMFEALEWSPSPKRNATEGQHFRGPSGLVTHLDPGSSQTDSSSSKHGQVRLPFSFENPLTSVHGRGSASASGKGPTMRSEEKDWQTTSDGESGLESSKSGGPSEGEAIARRHRGFLLKGDQVTGRTVSEPLGIELVHQQQAYQHPAPLAVNHQNPFVTSPPVLKEPEGPLEEGPPHARTVEESQPDRHSTASVFTDTFDHLVETHGSSFESGRGENPSSGHEWTTTTSDADNPPNHLPSQGFRSVSVPGAKQVGSSLAGVSSPPSTTENPGPPSYKTPTTYKHRHRRSSSDSKYEMIVSPNKTNTSALPSPWSQGHRKRNTMTGLMSSGTSSFYSDEETPDSPYQPNLRERKAHQAYTDHDEISSISGSAGQQANTYREQISPFASSTGLQALPNGNLTSQTSFSTAQQANTYREQISPFASSTGLQALPNGNLTSQTSFSTAQQAYGSHNQTSQTSVSAQSHAFLQDGIVLTDVPRPLFVHPVYGLDRLWGTPTLGRPQGRLDRYQRPIARRESPHLHRIPCPPTAVVRERQKGISGFWLVIFCIIPPVALIFGYGLADEIIRLQTDGEIHAFTDSSKKAALFWAYIGTPVIVAIIFIAVFFGTS